MSRLGAALLSHLAGQGIMVPGYNRNQACGVVHLGTGAFHRAHQAAYFDALLAAGETGWMIQGASLRSPRVAGQMNPQDGLYTMIVRDGGQDRLAVLGAIKSVLVAPDVPCALVVMLADPAVSLVTLTITEKGYCIDPASGTLRTDDPAVQADLKSLSAPKTAPGFLVAGLRARRAAGLAPFTVLSCDNLPHNGVLTREAVLAIARAHDPGLADWIADEGAFPSSMVDRIVPATQDADIDALDVRSGYRDEAMVKTEPFTQWVVEDWFAGRRPPLEKVGVQFTGNVAGWEQAKLRLLNGAHSALAYLGALAGHPFVHVAMAAPGYWELVNALWDEAQETLDPLEGFDPMIYRAALAARFDNPALQHRTHQIAMDGSLKLPQRLLEPIRIRRAAGLAHPALSLAVAGWLRWQFGEDDLGHACTVDDPLAAETGAILARHGGAVRAASREMLALSSVFGKDLPADDSFVSEVCDLVEQLTQCGAGATVAAWSYT